MFAAASRSNAARAAVTKPAGAPTAAAAACLFARLPGGDDRFRESINSEPSDASDGEPSEDVESPRLGPTSGDVGDNVYTVEPVLLLLLLLLLSLRSTGPMGPGDLASSSTNASATRSSTPGLDRLATSETSLESEPGVAGDAGAGAARAAEAEAEKESSEEGEEGKYTVGVALARAPRDRADSNLGLTGGRDATAPDATLPGVDVAAPADIQTSEESEPGLWSSREAAPRLRRAAAAVETPSDSKSEPDEPQSECGESGCRRRRANGDATRLKKRRGGEGFFFSDVNVVLPFSLVTSASARFPIGAAFALRASALASARMRCTVSSVALRMGPVEETSRQARKKKPRRCVAAFASSASSDPARKASSSRRDRSTPRTRPPIGSSRLSISGSLSISRFAKTKAP